MFLSKEDVIRLITNQKGAGKKSNQIHQTTSII
jgi:hypothetical protein